MLSFMATPDLFFKECVFRHTYNPRGHDLYSIVTKLDINLVNLDQIKAKIEAELCEKAHRIQKVPSDNVSKTHYVQKT